jgi:ubiquinone/menaquinone biosynthesis C-methylase UbiE
MKISHAGAEGRLYRLRWFGPRGTFVFLAAGLAFGLLRAPAMGAEQSKTPNPGAHTDPAKRPAAIKRVCDRLGIGPGKVIADVGCGSGTDTFTFAEVVGAGGKVYGEEIEQKPLDEMLQKARDRKLEQVVPVLGATEDPRLPDATMDLIYMHQVFHHFAQPASMLNNLWHDLKPGGYLVIVDRQKGPQREWVDLAQREKKHFWVGETTVVRQAREAGFLFEAVLDDLWFEKEPFVLVFRKPLKTKKPGGDPDLPSELKGKSVVSALPNLPGNPPQILFVGLDRGRSVLPALLQHKSRPRIMDAVLEEWTTVKAELPLDVQSNQGEVIRTAKGDLPQLANNVLNAAVFADGYSRLWDPAPLLQRVRQSLSADGYVAILDRKGPENEPRRLAGHHRRIAPSLVRTEMEQAGFVLAKELKAPAKDRFFLLFRRRGE